MAAYPFIEAWVTGDKREHHLLDRPRNQPTRTALGVAALTFYGVLMFAAANDIIAIKLNMSINDITYFFRAGTFILPVLAFWATRRICLSLQRADRNLVLHGRETGRIVRTADGRFFEAHEPLNEYERWKLVGYEEQRPLELTSGVDAHGVAAPGAGKLRARLSKFYFQDVVTPVTPEELAAAHHDGHEHEAIEAAEAAEIESGERSGAGHH